MGIKKMKLIPFLSQSKNIDSKLPSSPPWPFPSCGNINTLSFRANCNDDFPFRTFNSAFLDAEVTPPSCSSRTFSTFSEEDSIDPVENLIHGLSSDRFFFEPERSSSLLFRQKEEQEQEDINEEEENQEEGYKESEILSMDSNNPYEDFKRSMEEMIEAHGLKDWEGLEELLGCYLKINGKNNHGYIVGAFIDLMASFSFNESNTTSTSTRTTTTNITTSTSYSNYSSPSSPLSFPSSSTNTTPCL
ncbi:transcription repressor OFP15-like [Amaranthus tricolor]|uniref:transcription repressor OFP15-like n=1 Tax=Amaranthus tricolor TaxID=29722 RepID=UPI002587FADA|nr:transcription repressor OFP15-like [Amaranthus tricolor]